MTDEERESWERYIRDVEYDLLVPPLGLNYDNLTPKQAKENFNWFISKIPERMEYFKKRCSSDLDIDIDELDYSADSFLHVWRWFLNTALIEKTPEKEIEEMRIKFAHFGDS